MKKGWIWILGALLIVGGLAACQSATPTVAPATATRADSGPTLTLTRPALQTATVAPQATAIPTKSGGAGRPGPTPTVAWQVPEVAEGEWTKGEESAGLVLVEYSDYQ